MIYKMFKGFENIWIFSSSHLPSPSHRRSCRPAKNRQINKIIENSPTKVWESRASVGLFLTTFTSPAPAFFSPVKSFTVLVPSGTGGLRESVFFYLKKIIFFFHFACVKPEVVHDAGVVVFGAGSHSEGGHGVELEIRGKKDYSSPCILGRNMFVCLKIRRQLRNVKEAIL